MPQHKLARFRLSRISTVLLCDGIRRKAAEAAMHIVVIHRQAERFFDRCKIILLLDVVPDKCAKHELIRVRRYFLTVFINERDIQISNVK